MKSFDPRKILEVSWVYSSFQWLVGATRNRDIFINEYVRPKKNSKILDLGCGPADILAQMNDVDYVGMDENPDYIKNATQRFGEKGKFYRYTFGLGQKFPIEENSFDIVISNAVLHHLNDDQALELMKLAYKMLKPGGRYISADGCYVPDQSFLSAYLLSKDRGKFVRKIPDYVRLARMVFSLVEPHHRTDNYRIPCDTLFMECQKEH